MSILRSLLNLVQTWRRRPVAQRTRPCTVVELEQLDHRQLLAVNFTGNAIADIPGDIANPPLGTQFLVDNRSIVISPPLRNIIKVSGMDIDVVRMQYTPGDDTLSIALQQPLNQKTSPMFPVIAGDTDNNQDGGTVAPGVQVIDPAFEDIATLGGSETMTVTFDFNRDQIPDVVAGISSDPGYQKLYAVADAIPNPIDPINLSPSYGAPRQLNTGYSFLRDLDPTQGAFEFQVSRFSELYTAKTGLPFKTDSVINVGFFSQAANDAADEDFQPSIHPVNFGLVPPVDCPPISPPIQINPHQNLHVNTAHPNYVRVTLFGTSGFNVKRIVPGSVQFGGASPNFRFNRKVNADEFLDTTFVFRGDQLNLPPGMQVATLNALYNDPATGKQIPIQTSQTIFVRTKSAYSPEEISNQKSRLQADGDPLATIPKTLRDRAAQNGVSLIVSPEAARLGVKTSTVKTATTVQIRKREAKLHPVSAQATSRGAVIRRPATHGQTWVQNATKKKVTPALAAKHVKTVASTKLSAVDLHDLAMADIGAAR